MTSSTQRTRPRAARKIARTREDILLASASVFARHGFHQATMQTIAREAGYTAASLYGYFKSKQEIHDELVAMLTREMLAPFDDPTPAGLTFRQRLELLILRQMEVADRYRDAFTVFAETKPWFDADAPGGGSTELRGRDLFAQHMAQWIGRTATQEELGGRDPEDIAHYLIAIGHVFFRRWLSEGGPTRLAHRVPAVLDLFWYGVAGQPAEAAGARGRAHGHARAASGQ